MQGKVITVASGKGGVGKTTTAVNLAVALWRERNTVALIDADLGMANLAAVLALEPTATLHDVLSGAASLDDALIEANDGDLLVLPGERELVGFANADPAELRSVLADLAGRCDYVIVDTGAGLSHEDVLPLGLADEVLLVTTPDPAAIGDTRKTLQLAGLLDGPVVGVVVTRALEDTDADAIADEVGAELLGTIPEDPTVTESTREGDPLEASAPDAPATAAYRALAGRIEDVAPQVDDDSDVGPADGTETDEPGNANEVDDLRRTSGGDDGDDSEPGGESELGENGDVAAGRAAEETPTSGDTGSADTDPDHHETNGTTADVETSDSMEAAGESNREDATRPAATDGSDAPDGSDESDSEPDTEDEPTRGGFFGWLGRLFS